ncbi:ATP-binding cassette domain-containing protein [Phaeobacter inhibens]|uniref:ATP-binding cassette domain-containing protein n=1 Tax=Phaeobacter inhibens TaxID=221822 RepID=UPI000C9A482A|nr:ATP-binding cassette domain-containing protein [Phaeobacter inhibens]AUQ67408.1 ABC-type bacteriocin/lantibiotic exporter [Phaeobacter inhibens]
MNTLNTSPEIMLAERVDAARGDLPEKLQNASEPAAHADASQAEAILSLLLDAAGWDADPARIRAALPHARRAFDGWDLCDALVALRAPHSQSEANSAAPPNHPGPDLLTAQNGRFRLAGGPFEQTAAQPGETRISIVSASVADRRPAAGSVAVLLRGLRTHFWSLLLASFVINLAGLLTPVFVILVYNRAVPAGAASVIFVLVTGLLLAFATEIAIRRIRSQTLVRLAAQLEHRLSLALLNKLMVFPLGSLTSAPVEQQRARLKQFEAVRGALAGPLVHLGLDIPFVVIFGAALFFIAPPVGLVALAAALVQAGFLIGFAPQLRRLERLSNDSARDLRKVSETVVNERLHLRRLHGQAPWRQRFHQRLSLALDDVMRQQFMIELSAHVSQTIILVAGVSGAMLATRMAIQGNLTVGGFVAILVVIWRFLAPVQSLGRAAGQALAARQSLQDIDSVLALPEENRRGVAPRRGVLVAPPVVVELASLRLAGSRDLALAGVGLKVNMGEITVLSGSNLSGKTILAETVAGLHELSAGRILLNGADLRQIPADDLRRAIAFAPQAPAFFYGTIWQNFELAVPGVDPSRVLKALEEAGVREEVQALPGGIDTRLTVEVSSKLPYELKQGLSVARALLQPGPVRIFDQPAESLDDRHARRIRAAIARRRAASATLLISNHPDDLALGDHYVALHRGRVVLSGSGSKGREKVAAYLHEFPAQP